MIAAGTGAAESHCVLRARGRRPSAQAVRALPQSVFRIFQRERELTPATRAVVALTIKQNRRLPASRRPPRLRRFHA